MYKLLIERRAYDFLEKLKREKKHYIQVISKLLSLTRDPYPNDAKKIKGEKLSFLRVDAGEFRIVYLVEDDTIKVVVIGRRNDDEVYRMLGRI